MRKEPDDDLATALPPSLTVDLHLPEPVHEAPQAEDVVAIDAVAVTASPSEETPATMSIAISTQIAEVVREADDVAEPAEIVPLPEHPEAPVVEVKPARSTRTPAAPR